MAPRFVFPVPIIRGWTSGSDPKRGGGGGGGELQREEGVVATEIRRDVRVPPARDGDGGVPRAATRRAAVLGRPLPSRREPPVPRGRAAEALGARAVGARSRGDRDLRAVPRLRAPRTAVVVVVVRIEYERDDRPIRPGLAPELARARDARRDPHRRVQAEVRGAGARRHRRLRRRREGRGRLLREAHRRVRVARRESSSALRASTARPARAARGVHREG